VGTPCPLSGSRAFTKQTEQRFKIPLFSYYLNFYAANWGLGYAPKPKQTKKRKEGFPVVYGGLWHPIKGKKILAT
jgi:hypothetical protein